MLLLFDGESLFIYFSFFLHCSEVQIWGRYQKENKVEFSENMNIVSPKSDGQTLADSTPLDWNQSSNGYG